MKKGIILVILVLCLISTFYLVSKLEKKEDNFKIVTSFYPVYVITSNIAKDIEGIEVVNMAPSNVGCIHDYTLTTNDIKKIEESDIFVINGAGMEENIENVLNNYNLNIIDSSKDISLLKYIHDDEEEYNPHIWINPNNYLIQIENITNGLIKYDSKNKDKYLHNKEIYVDKINKLIDDMKSIDLSNKNVIIFHESFEYLKDILNMNIKYVVSIDEDESLTTSMLRKIIEEIKKNNIEIAFIESQLDSNIINLVKNEVNIEFYTLDSLVTGDNTLDSYINGMNYNIAILKEVLE